MRAYLVNALKGNLTIGSLVLLILCLGLKKYGSIQMPDEIFVALVAGVIAGLRRAQSRIEAILSDQVPKLDSEVEDVKRLIAYDWKNDPEARLCAKTSEHRDNTIKG